MSKKILVTLHPGFTNTPAIKRASKLATLVDADITLYSVVYDENIPNLAVSREEMDTLRDAILKSEHRKLEQIQSELEEVASSVKVLAEWKPSIADSVANMAKHIDADLIIVSSTRHSMMSRLFLSNTDWEVLRQAARPVLFAHHQPDKPYKTIMVAVDPMHQHDEPAQLDNRLVEEGQAMGKVFDGEVCLAHAYPALRAELVTDYVIPYELAEKWKQEHQDAVFRLAKKYAIDNEHVHLLDEHPREAIPEIARNVEADLVVMGVVSRADSEQASIGHTAEYVLDHLDCDVLVVPVKETKA